MTQNPIESFAPLVTQVQTLPPEGGQALHKETTVLPRSLGLLLRAGSRLRRSLLVSCGLAFLSLALLAALLAYPDPASLVVWEERATKPLVVEESP